MMAGRVSAHRRVPVQIILAAGVIMATAASPRAAHGAGAEPAAVALTIYSTAQPGAVDPRMYMPRSSSGGYVRPNAQALPGYAVVKQERELEIPASRSSVRFTDVAALIDPTTVSFESLTDPAGTRVLEQNYQFDLVGTDTLLQRYLDRRITVEQAHGEHIESLSGKLLSTSGGLVLQKDDGGVQILSSYTRLTFPELPGGLITRPTLVWRLATEQPGTHRTRVTYQTGGMTWWADYNLVFSEGKDANHGRVDVGAWVSIVNRSGAGYADAKLKLIAGNVHRAQAPRRRAYMMESMKAVGRTAAPAGFAEKAFFEYHLYTLGRRTTLNDKSTKQIELFPVARGVPAEKILVYYGRASAMGGVFSSPALDRNFGTQSNRKVDIYLRFKNEKKAGLGIPLPAGRIRVSKLDPADQSLEFIGEDTIDHTPRDEPVLIKLGSAFDVVGERKQVGFQVDSGRKQMSEEIEITLRNHKKEAVRVIVKENLYRWVNWEIRKSNQKYEKIDSRTIHFPVRLAAHGEKKVRYTVRYSW